MVKEDGGDKNGEFTGLFAFCQVAGQSLQSKWRNTGDRALVERAMNPVTVKANTCSRFYLNSHVIRDGPEM